MDSLGVVVGNPPSYGYGAGARAFENQLVQSPPYPGTPYPAQLYGYADDAELRGMGDITSFLQSIAGGIQNAAQGIENIARGVAVGSSAASQVIGKAAQGGGTLFQPSAADIIAQQSDVNSLLGIPTGTIVLLGGAVLLFVLMSRKH
jgi:hypothetical protein